MVAVPTSNTWRMCGALPARNAAMAAVIDSGYCPLKTGTTLYSFWLALKPLAMSFSRSLSAPVIECHHWISTCAWTADETSDETRQAPISAAILWNCMEPLLFEPRRLFHCHGFRQIPG